MFTKSVLSSVFALFIMLFSFIVWANNNESNTRAPIAIALHGGAGTLSPQQFTPELKAQYYAKLSEALEAGYRILQTGADGQDAVVAAIMFLENSPLFNAGVGAVYTFDTEHELDASIMHGKTREAGAIAGVKHIKNPILAAQAVMNHSVHVMLSGDGAETFAEQFAIERVDNTHFNTERRLQSLHEAKARIKRQASLNYQHPEKFGTVGVVVLDQLGNLVAGTSTGGMTAKRFGRIGDSPIIGAGTFADNTSCAVSATGHGEYFIRYRVASDICKRISYQNISLAEAADIVINRVLVDAGGDGGVVAVDGQGNVAMPFNTTGMYRASIDANGVKTVAIFE